jgi:predicted RNA-binding protein with PUA-like domain
MAGSTWLVKSEPDTYSWNQLVKDGSTRWDGVRNPQARNNLAAMQKDDRVLFYHSGDGKAVVGIARVTRTAYPDPTAGDDRWLAVDLAPEGPLARPVTLAEIKAEPSLAKIPLVTQSRLSVQPVPKPAFDRIVSIGSRVR